MTILQGIKDLTKVQGDIVGATYDQQTGTYTVFVKTYNNKESI